MSAPGEKKLAPVGFNILLDLTAQGISAASIAYSRNVGLQSPKFISVREEKSVAILDTATKNSLRLPVAVDSAIVNPISKVVALRADKNLQIYNLEIKAKMKATSIAENVNFWRWLDAKTIAIVTDNSVYHWSIEGDSSPTKIFDRTPADTPVQIINYRASADGKWLILGGLAQSPGGPLPVSGVLQIYSVDLSTSPPSMDAHAACFLTVKIEGRDTPSNLFCSTKIDAAGARVNVIEVGVPKTSAFTATLPFTLEAGDFPVALVPDNKFGSLFLLTKNGYLHVAEVQSGKTIFSSKVSAATPFASIEDEAKGGVVTIDQKGRVTHFYIDAANVVNYICNVANDYEFGLALAKRYDLPGAEGLFKSQFQRLLQSGQTDEAMQLAATSPGGVLRTKETIELLKSQGTGQGLLMYFQMLLKTGKLNAVESIELARPVLRNPAQGLEHIRNWLKEQKLEPSEEFGDLLKQYDLSLALSVYLRAKVPVKVIGCFLSLAAQEADETKAKEYLGNILAYSNKVGHAPDFPYLVSQLLRVNRDRARDFAIMLLKNEDGPKLEIMPAVDLFLSAGDVKNTTAILLDFLRPRGDREEDAALQTRLLEINLLSAPQVADAILESADPRFTHYDRLKIAQLCERAGLFQRALEHYTELSDIKRVLLNTHALDANFLLEYFGRLASVSIPNALECLKDLLRYNLTANIRLVVEVAKKWSDVLTPEALIAMFEEFKSANGLYFYLGSFVNFSDNKQVVFKYIEAATKLGQLKEVERVCREHEHYDAKEVKEFLLAQNLKEPRALIYLCDKHGFIEELTQYLFSSGMTPYIEAYVQRMNSKAAPKVMGSLLDLNAPEDLLRKLLDGLRPPPDDPSFLENLVGEVEKRNRLKMLRQWLEARAAEGNENTHLHNGLGKIYVESNINPRSFLENNKFYDSKVVGKFCEMRDPHLAFIAYKRAAGTCDDELVDVTNKNGFFKDQAKYLVERQDQALWAKVLDEKQNTYRRQLIDQVVATALPESQIPEEVSSTVRAFMAANLPNELIELLERIILHGPPDGEFQSNKNLQNLLILTAIKADAKRVMDYVKRLDNYDGTDIAKIAISDPYNLYEEAFFIYKKFKQGSEAIQVLLEQINSVERATEFAEYWDQPEVWSILGKAQLDANLVKDAIKSLLKAQDASHYLDVITAAKHEELYDDLILFLRLARTKLKDPQVDNELIYCFAKTNRLADLEEFISQPNSAKLNDCAEACFAEELFEAAKILFNQTNNNARLSVTLVRLKQYSEAVDAARKANNIHTWKAVCFACVDAEKFRLASMCGVNIIVYMEHLTELIAHYENGAHFDEVIALLEQGINLDRAHQGIYTHLGILYAKYKEEKLMEHIRMFWSRLNIPTLIGACQVNLHWPEAVYLNTQYGQHDAAIDILISHSPDCWKHELFKEIINKVSNTEIFYRAIDFYLQEHPLLLNDLLIDLAPKLDHNRVVHKLRIEDRVALGVKYLQSIQRENLQPVNEALNQLYIQEENYKALRESIDNYRSFDMIATAQLLEKHELLEFRRISAYLWKVSKRWERSLELSKKDRLWADCMETAGESKDQALAESLLYFFVENNERECFGAALYTCYELIRPDVVLELAWRFNLMNFAMPFMIQSFREYDDKLNAINAKLEEKEKKDDDKEAEKKQDEAAQAAAAVGLMPTPLLALPAPPPSMAGPYGHPGPSMGMGHPGPMMMPPASGFHGGLGFQ